MHACVCVRMCVFVCVCVRVRVCEVVRNQHEYEVVNQ